MSSEGGFSVGRAYEVGQAYSVNHPRYRVFADSVAARVAELSVSRGFARASGRVVPMGVALHAEEIGRLVADYPEFNLASLGTSRPGHAYWTAFRRLANEWLYDQASVYSRHVAHLGGSLSSYLVAGAGVEAVLLYDLMSPVAVHEKYAASLEAHEWYSDYGNTSKALGKVLDHRSYDAYLRKESVRGSSNTAAVPSAEVLCVDLSLHSYSPMQVACMMQQSGAAVAFGFFVYHPVMLFRDRGELPGTGVSFVRAPGGVLFTYPDGTAGVSSYAPDVWESWIVGHSFAVGTGRLAKWYQLELLKNRGHLMFFRVTAVTGEVSSSVVHALEIGGDESYVVNSWALKSVQSDPSLPISWDNRPLVLPRRLVDRVYQFAMQLPRDQFTRYAIRKEIQAVNDRVTVEGTLVRVNESLPPDTIDALVVAVYSRAFVDRYEAGTLTSELMESLKRVTAYASAGRIVRSAMVVSFCLRTALDYTVGAINSVIRSAADAVRDKLGPGMPRMEVVVDELPPYMLIGSAVRGVAGFGSGVGLVATREKNRKAALSAGGFASRWANALACIMPAAQVTVEEYRSYRVEAVDLFAAVKADGPAVAAALAEVKQAVALDEEPASRAALQAQVVVRQARSGAGRRDFDPVADPVGILNALHSEAFPGVGAENLEHDTASISLDPQDRTIEAVRLKLPKYMGDAPASRSYFKSKIKALNVPKRQQTLPELLSAMTARNLSAPQVSLAQDEQAKALEVWNVFLDHACVPGARKILVQYQNDPASLSEESFREWAAQSGMDKLSAVRKELEEMDQGLGDMSVSEYLAMLKSDVKPPLSNKPLDQRIEPQVIVYHSKALSALFSSLFRVLVRRFLAILKPNYHVNLLKDTRDMEGFLNGIHPYGRKGLKYLENDFSKYDKSQGRFVFVLEALVFSQLGMNQEMLDRWLAGHVKCSMRALGMGLSLSVYYQRKSGDATTSFGNVLLNVLSVTYAYRGTDVIWALFMGDDSLVCSSQVCGHGDAAAVLAEVFNLGAKYFITESPYFASNFVIIDVISESVALVPDPVKRAERWSMHVSAIDPQWHERYISACDALGVYLNVFDLAGMAKSLVERYGVSYAVATEVGSAIATVLSDEKKFRGMWEDEPEVSLY